MASIYLKTLPLSVGKKTRAGAVRKFITPQLQSQLKKKANLWKLVKKNSASSDATRLRKQATELGLTLSFVSTSVEKVTSSKGRSYYRTTGDIYVSYQN